jgi:predicted  nucleic acid-binding Zn-ribbon protein
MESILKLNVKLMAEIEKLKDEQYKISDENFSLKRQVSDLEEKIQHLQDLKCLKVRSRLLTDIRNIEARMKAFEKFEEETYGRKRVRRVRRVS